MRANGLSDEMKATLDAGQRLSELVVSHGFGQASGFYGFVRECLEQLRAARSRGLWTAVEQNIAAREVVDRLAREEQERFPAWKTSAAQTTFAEAYGAREKAEWAESRSDRLPLRFRPTERWRRAAVRSTAASSFPTASIPGSRSR